MSLGPRKNENLYNSKHATVSLDSFLGLLSSTYGTEQLDSRIIFEKEKVNWSNISVENLRALPRREETDFKYNEEEDVKVTVGTSTTSLRRRNTNYGDIDETLLSIKSLTSLQQIKSDTYSVITESESILKNNVELEECVSKASSSHLEDDSKNQMDDLTASGETIDNYQLKMTPVCGFRVEDNNKQIIFDIQFVKKASSDNELIPEFEIGEPEIFISIKDIVKPMESNAKMSKNSLVSKVKYFAEVEKEFGLNGLNVIVRCNFGVFQWVLQWLISDIPMCKPNLNVSNLKAILSMANNLGIDLLVQECLEFFRRNLDTILDSDREIEDIFEDDMLLLDFTKRFTNADVENLKDSYGSFKNKLFCTLIRMLADPNPCQEVGHFSSLSTMFQCGMCGKIMHKHLMGDIPCRSDCTQVSFKGKLEYHHELSSFWNLTNLLASMYEDLQDWRLVYWQLWGMCHFFHCEICYSWYPLNQSDWCPYHLGEVEYFPMGNSLNYPIGTYRCCGEKTFGFDVVKQHSGCRYKSHVSKLDTLEKVEKFNIHQDHKNLINQPPPEDDSNVKKFVKLVKKSDESTVSQNEKAEKFWWDGIRLSPEEKTDYSVIPLRVLNILRNKPQEKKDPKIHSPLKFKAQFPFGSITSLNSKISEREPRSNGEDPHLTNQTQTGKKSRPAFCVKKGRTSNVFLGPKNRTKKKKSLSYVYQPVESVWSDLEANKDNQDNQRDFEEIAMRKLVQMLTPADGSGSSKGDSAGTYIRLETEWWQRNCGSHINKNSSTVVNRTFPLSWFRKLTI